MAHTYSLEEIIAILSSTLADMESRAVHDSNMGELSMRQVYYLEVITGMERPTSSDLARRLSVTRPSVTAIVNRLVEKGYVTKVPSGEDKRSSYLLLTDKGERFAALHRNVHRMIARRLVSRLTSAEQQQLVGLLRKIVEETPASRGSKG